MGTDALVSDFENRKRRLLKQKSNKKLNISDVDKDLFYYDLTKSSCAIMTYDINRGKVFLSPNANSVFDFDVVTYFNNKDRVELLSFVHPDDAQNVLTALSQARITLNMSNTAVRLSTPMDKNSYTKYNATFLCVVNEGGTPVRYHCYLHKF